MTDSSRPKGVAGLSHRLDEAAHRFGAGDLIGAARLYREAERIDRADLRAPYSLAIIDIRQGRLARARERLSAIVAAAPGHFEAQHNLGVVAQQLGDWPAAAAAYEAAVAVRPRAHATREALATALAILGHFTEAIAQHRALAAMPDRRWGALTRIALLDADAIDDSELTSMRGAAGDIALHAETRAGLLFALGEVLEHRGESAASFEAFAEGNRLKRSLVDAGAAARANSQAAQRACALFTPEFVAANVGRGHRSAAPIFIVGFPRSGSTLLEQVLASHPAVQGLGETAVLPALLADRYPTRGRMAASQLGDMAERYLSAMRARGWDGRSRFVDKTLENYLHVGMIHLLFPRATVLHTTRDPVETGFSCFRQLFASGNETLYDLAEIGAEFRRYRGLMAHWRAVLPGRVNDVSYESLVAEPEKAVKALLDRLGLPWEPAVLRFHERDGAVRTASAVQVRRPISSSGARRARAHLDQLGPLIAALEDD